MNTRHTVIDSALGELTLVAREEKITGLYFRRHFPRPSPEALGEPVAGMPDLVLSVAAEQVCEYLAGHRKRFYLPVDVGGTARQRKVWNMLCHIDYGLTTSYGALAAAVGDGLTAYEVGQIVGRNPLSIIVPCHRVVGSNGALTGYAGGLSRKRFLLDLEEREPAVAGRLF